MDLLLSDWAYVVGLALLAALCTFVTFYEGFDDNLGERCGMSAMTLGAVSEINAVWTGNHLEAPVKLLVFGIVIFTASAAYSIIKDRLCGSSKH